MCFFSFCIKSAKRDKNSNSVQILCLFFTVCLKAQKSFNYYIIKMKSKLAFVILRKFLFRSDLDLCLLRWVLFHYRFCQFSSGRISVLCTMYSLVSLPFVVLVGSTKTCEVCVCFLKVCPELFHLCVLIVVFSGCWLVFLHKSALLLVSGHLIPWMFLMHLFTKTWFKRERAREREKPFSKNF